MGIPLHHYGVMSTEYGQKRDVLYSKFKVCRFCRDGRGVLCSYASENYSNGSCLVCMITSANKDAAGKTCAGCRQQYIDSANGQSWRQEILLTLLTALDRKLKFCVPSSMLNVEAFLCAEKRTYGQTSTGDGRGEKRYDYLMEVTTGVSRVLHLALELVSTAEIQPQSLELKVADLIARMRNHSGARAAMLVIYLDKDRPLAHLVLVRQIVNALVVNGGRLQVGKHVTVYTSGTMSTETPEALAKRWDRLRTTAQVTDRTSVRHLPSNFCPVDPAHDFKYCIHPNEVKILEDRTGFIVAPGAWV
jgi:hypothetical protein